MFKKLLQSIYTEEYTVGEFTFGFELEGVLDGDVDHPSELLELFDKEFQSAGISIHSEQMKDDGSISSEPCPKCGGDGESYDGGECEYCNGDGNKFRTFEFASPTMNITPQNISFVIKFLQKGLKERWYTTNESCGFHVHIGLPNEFNSEKERFWILCNIAMNKEISELVSHLQDDELSIDFFNETYASTRYLSILSKAITDGDLSSINGIFNSVKYRSFRIHPKYNTIEWRGPRGFLHEETLNSIHTFFMKKLIPLVRFFKKTLSADIMCNTTLTKKEFTEKVVVSDDLRDRKTNRKKMKDPRFAWDNFTDIKLVAYLKKLSPSLLKKNILEGVTLRRLDDSLELSGGIMFDGVVDSSLIRFRKMKKIDNCTLSNVNIRSSYVYNSILTKCKCYLTDHEFQQSNKYKNCDIELGALTVIAESVFDGCIFSGFLAPSVYSCNIKNSIFKNCDFSKVRNSTTFKDEKILSQNGIKIENCTFPE